MQVHFILPATENMVDGGASRPSDIVSASNGKTVEVRLVKCGTSSSTSGAVACGSEAGTPSYYVQTAQGPSACLQIVDTDAEGRLTLADALVFAEQLGVEAIVDIATREPHDCVTPYLHLSVCHVQPRAAVVIIVANVGQQS